MDQVGFAEKSKRRLEKAYTAQPNPSFEVRSQKLDQGLIDGGVCVQMVMAVNKMARQAGVPVKFPLACDFPEHDIA